MERKQNTTRDPKKQLLHLMVVLMVVVLMLLSVSLFSSRTRQSILDRELWQAEQVAHYISQIVQLEIQRCQDVLETSKYRFENAPTRQAQPLIPALAAIQDAENTLYRVGLTDMDGNSIYDDGSHQHLDNPQLLETIAQGEMFISNTLENNLSQEDSLQLAVPIRDNGQITGALIGYYQISRISEILKLTDSSLRYFQIISVSGEYISSNHGVYAFTTGESMWEELENYSFDDGMTPEKLRQSMERGEEGIFRFTYQDQGRYVAYEPLGINDWYIFSALVEADIDNYITEINLHFKRFLIWFILLTVVLAGAILIADRIQRRIIQKQNQELTIKNKLFDMVLDKSRDIPFEIDLPSRQLTLLSSRCGRQLFWEDFSPDAMLAGGHIRQEGYDKYQRLYQGIFSGENLHKPVLQMNLDGQWHWYKFNSLQVTAEKLVGFLEDFDLEMRQRQLIEKTSQQLKIDALTGLYRRESCARLVAQRQRQRQDGKLGAFFLIDLDGFKQINDTLGHLMGDQALIDAAAAIRSVTRKDDIAGRLGGDEFVVYLSGFSNQEQVRSCAGKVNAALRRSYDGPEGSLQVSASIGIVVHTQEHSFQELYEKADKALYYVKQHGKDSCHLVEL